MNFKFFILVITSSLGRPSRPSIRTEAQHLQGNRGTEAQNLLQRNRLEEPKLSSSASYSNAAAAALSNENGKRQQTMKRLVATKVTLNKKQEGRRYYGSDYYFH